MKGTNSAFNSASSIQPRVKHTFCYGCISPHADGCISPHAEAAPYMLDKNTPWRNVLSVLAFCFFLFLFSIRRVTLFFLFLFLFNLVCNSRRITYITYVWDVNFEFSIAIEIVLSVQVKENALEYLIKSRNFTTYIYSIYIYNKNIYNNLVCLFNIIESKLFYFMKNKNKDINKNSKLEKILLQSFQDLQSIIYNFSFRKSKDLWNYCSIHINNIDNIWKWNTCVHTNYKFFY